MGQGVSGAIVRSEQIDEGGTVLLLLAIVVTMTSVVVTMLYAEAIDGGRR